MTYELKFNPEAIKDYRSLDNTQRRLVDKALKRILMNPLPKNEGGYGSPLSNLKNAKLAGLLKIKLKNAGIRIIYQLEKREEKIIVIIIGMREDNKVYLEAEKRLRKTNR